MLTLLAAISDETGLQLIHGTIGKQLLLDKHERSQDVVVSLIAKVILMNIVTDSSFFNTDTRRGF